MRASTSGTPWVSPAYRTSCLCREGRLDESHRPIVLRPKGAALTRRGGGFRKLGVRAAWTSAQNRPGRRRVPASRPFSDEWRERENGYLRLLTAIMQGDELRNMQGSDSSP
jgi:hypothetical protein